MYEDPLPPLPASELAQVFSDELNWLLALIGEIGSAELQQAARERMFSLPERVRQAREGEDHAARV